ncbi:hypothetical protein [Clostridium sp. 1001275B_160808_H3]|uniref:hypothetical protein n=1 Tax=Clostridium sp. 1001275B_160808_H3 TaxID=2787110 RepID=UPI00189950FB|nr:hypothetical protein [Clostridium sp. 1001275B_160808_H3]
MIFRLKSKCKSEDIREIEEKLSKKFREKVILIPNGLELVSNIYEIKEEDIRITDVRLQTDLISCEGGIVEHILVGTKVSFEYKDISANLFIKGNIFLSIKEMKREIINRFSIKESNVKEDMQMW